MEIERRYLLSAQPTPAQLAALGARPRQVEQAYLRRHDEWVRRVRRIEEAGSARFVATRKRDAAGVAGGIARDEIEHDITSEEYARCLADADPARRVIRKVRHVIPWERWTLELDVFASPRGLVLLEVELDNVADVPSLPPVLAELVVREVTDDPAYTNYGLALVDGEGAPTAR